MRASLLAASIVLLLSPSTWAQVPWVNQGGVVAYEPIVDTVTSGSQVLWGPTVSADRKYVTLSGSCSSAS